MQVTANGYEFTAGELPGLQVAKFYPERTSRESQVLRAFLNAHGPEYDRFVFSVRVGAGIHPDPDHLIGVQRSTVWSTRKRIDLVCWSGQQPTLVEAKQRVEPSALGQILGYRHLWMEDNPDVPEPRLIVIGATTDQDTLRVLGAHGIDVFIYTPTEAE